MSHLAPPASLTDLLGETRGSLLRLIQGHPLTVGELAEKKQISAAAVRRHMTALHGDDLVQAETVHDGGMGRPADRWTLTAKGKRLFADRSSEFADELLDHIEATYGRAAVAEFLKTRNARQADAYAEEMSALDGTLDRVRHLADALSRDGFAARVESGDNGRTLTLLQSHCAIEGIAREHPEICAHEAALFKRVLGTNETQVRVSRRQTIAGGSTACVCHIEIPADTAGQSPLSPTTEPPPSDRSA